ncbi:hypothetical protein CMI37_00980 [Candidatus Pacearchaeota archaeon]|nr:hypothetical protein [Candidatus Pacearchaeota archaeon]|tara:strand:+ start:2619 stop:4559 length:1941 start_codon:yes stop_codon:yes gene_type:complete
MALKRYKANADNTIVNTYLADLSNRGTGSNSGQADVMEIYSVYGRQSSGSQELSRILVNFPVSQITTDRSSGKLPSSGSVKFYLRLFSAESSKTVPKDFKLVVQPVSHSWQEGDGLDLENYSDITNNGTGSNWINAGNRGRPETSKVQFVTDTASSYEDEYVLLTDSYRKLYAFWFNNGGGSAPDVAPDEVEVDISAGSTAAEYSNKFKLAVLSSSANITAASASSPAATTKTTNKLGGAVRAATRDTSLSDSILIVSTVISGSGSGPWRNVGGDYMQTGRDGNAGGTGLTFTQRFSTGLENVEIDITKLVERWLAGTTNTYGVGVRLSASFEAYSKTAVSGTVKNVAGAKKSYYTKRFFARGSQFFFKRPVLEARWNSVRKDDRGDFYFSSSLGTDEDNMNTLYLYNYVRGRLRNIPAVGTGKLYVKLYSGSSDNTKPNTTPLRIHVPYSRSTDRPRTVYTASWHSTGIYTCSVCLTKSATRTVSNLYDVWYNGTTQYFTGSILPKTLSPSNHSREPVYYLNITNLQREYTPTQNARFNLYVRNKYWDPTIYTKANSTPATTTIPSASYRVSRIIDGLEAVPHYTGSNFATGLSYDVSGNYFDLDMKLLQPGYEYALRFAFYDPELVAWQEQDEIFKFRVRKNEH